MTGRFAGRALVQAQDIGHDFGAFLFEGLGGQADRAQEIRPLRDMLPQACLLPVEGVMARHHGQHATRFQGVEGFRQKEIMQGEARAGIVESEIGEGHIADDGVDAIFEQTSVAEVFDADVMAGIERAGDAPEMLSSSTPMKRMLSGASPMKLPMPQPGSSTVASSGTPKCLSAPCMARMTSGAV